MARKVFGFIEVAEAVNQVLDRMVQSGQKEGDYTLMGVPPGDQGLFIFNKGLTARKKGKDNRVGTDKNV